MGKKALKSKSRQKPAAGNDGDADPAFSAEVVADAVAERLHFDVSAEASGVAATSPAERRELLQALKQLREKLTGLKNGACAALQQKAEATSSKVSAKSEGPSTYMEMKAQLLLSYLTALSYYLVLKISGVPVRQHPIVPRLLWIRTLLEKLKPVDQRLQYQIGKLLQWSDARKSGLSQQSDTGDARALRPGDLAATVEDEDDEAEDDEVTAQDGDKPLGAYRPPKIAQVEYTGDHISMKERAEKELERKKARLDRSEFMRSLREEFTDAPKEVMGELRNDRADKAARLMREQQEYEEDTMTRMRIKKVELRKQRQTLRDGRVTSGGAVSLSDATADFNDILRGAERGKGKGKGKRKGGGGVLQEFKQAKQRAHGVRESLSSAMESAPKGRKGKSGGAKMKKRR